LVLLVALAGAANAGEWSKTTENTPLSSIYNLKNQAIAVNGKVFVVSQNASQDALKGVHVFNPATGAHEALIKSNPSTDLVSLGFYPLNIDVDGSKIYAMEFNPPPAAFLMRLRAYNKTTGSVAWTSTEDLGYSSIKACGDKVLAEYMTPIGYGLAGYGVKALNAGSGSTAWTHSNGITLLPNDGFLYRMLGTDGIHCDAVNAFVIDGQDHAYLYKLSLSSGQASLGSNYVKMPMSLPVSVVSDGDPEGFVYVSSGLDNESILKYKKGTLELEQEVKNVPASRLSLLGEYLAATSDGAITVYRLPGLSVARTFTVPGMSFNSSSVLASEGGKTVLYSTGIVSGSGTTSKTTRLELD
ncbi:MAG TPA: hypothetical protein VJI67_01015, partial [archaeon]|nr:hypothetical protein [archaeon]